MVAHDFQSFVKLMDDEKLSYEFHDLVDVIENAG